MYTYVVRRNLGIATFLVLLLLGYWIIDYLSLGKPISTSGGSGLVSNTITTNGQQSSLVSYTYESVVSGLEVPWSLVFTSPQRLLVTERPGRIRQIVDGQLDERVLIRFAEVSSTDEEGLMGLAIHPDYSINKRLYTCYAYRQGGQLVDKVISLIDQENLITIEKVILDNIPAAQFHAGCRIKFGHDRKLYITTGDATNKDIAQDLNSLGGKILRLNDDGSIPADNPFPNSPVYSYGHRNPQGIAWHPETGVMYATEHGPSGFDGPGGGDEINVILKGYNYGWPLVSHEKNQDGLQSPALLFTPAVAPASASFYSGEIFPEFKSNFFFGVLRGEGIYRVVFSPDNPNHVVLYEKLGIEVGRVRDVVTGPDGYIYFSSSNRDGRGKVRDGDDHVYRVIPAEN